MATLILIRHGQSLGNAERRFTHGPEEPLTDQGRDEARAAGRLVAAHYAPVALYASPFDRAQETARLIGESIGLELETVENLREQYFGELHGQPYDSFAALAEDAPTTRWQRRPPGGETLREVAERAGPALDAIARRHAGDPVVVVSHGGVMAALRGYTARDLNSEPEVPKNAAGYILRHDGTTYQAPDEIGKTQ
ncbi:MAG: histidine phosphatase family protein [Deltaproteobacteria bacterium]|nr:histidine phosphatase family protein [Deltaproteobacteria bacterium]